MNQKKLDNNDLLNAFIDDELANDERMQMLDELKHDDASSLELCELRRNDDFLSMAFTASQSKVNLFDKVVRKQRTRYSLIAASFFLAVATIFSVNFYISPTSQEFNNIASLSSLDANKSQQSNILIHISEMDPDKINTALTKTEQLLSNKNMKANIEIVANANGLGLLRKGSPYQATISKLKQNHQNVSFKACGIAMAAAKAKEGRDIELIPQADKIPAALDEILDRLKLGWLYFKA